ncbi:TetR/AcrR family transcriptional regulator [Streptomyces sp. CAU 1734]|uniref:TetR/AcrR family transcriptional regulator n=1 Tax=Streptomyces sp. CAU 1734 TaxID=3140360 RepID=UPI0032612A5E
MVSAADRAKGSVRTSVWLDGKADRGRRSGGQPVALDRERIVGATVRLLDAEGDAKFSMRRLAADLEVTAMSVYWYVDTKDDLLELALDAAFGEFRLPDLSDPAAWRDQLRTMADEYRSGLVRHPWVAALIGSFLNIGPNSMAFSRAALQVMRNSGLSPERQMAGLSAVFQFVYGFGTIEGNFIARCASAGVSQDAYFRQAMSAIETDPDPDVREYLADASEVIGGDGSEDSVPVMRDQHFTFALELLIAGIEAMAERE